MLGRDGVGWSQGNYVSIINEVSHWWADFQVTSSITNRLGIQINSALIVTELSHSFSQMVFMATPEVSKTSIVGNIL